MIETESFYLIVALILLLDLGVTAGRTGLVNSRLPKLINIRDVEQVNIDATLHLLSPDNQLLIRMRVSQALLRFSLLGLLIFRFFAWLQTAQPLWPLGLIVLTTTLLVALMEYLVEVYILKEPERWGIRLTNFIRFMFLLFTPVLIIPVLVSRLFAKEPDRAFSMTEDELITMLDASEEEGMLEQEARQMIKSVFQLRDTYAREIMVPRIDVLALDSTTEVMDAVEQMLESGFSRVPVYEDLVDRVVGVLYVKDLLRLCRTGQTNGKIATHTRPAYFVPETKRVDDLLTEMQQERIHIAMVVDEYGGVAGLVTLEDIVEELVGEIQDEYDQIEEKIYQQIGDGEYIFQGGIDIDDFNDIMHSSLSIDEADTLGGLIYSQIGRIPKGGETIRTNDLLLTVEQVTGRRIRKVKVRRLPGSQSLHEEVAHADG